MVQTEYTNAEERKKLEKKGGREVGDCIKELSFEWKMG